MDNVSGVLIRFKDQFLTFTNVPGIKIGVIDIIEILIISVLFYHILLWIKTTRAWNLFILYYHTVVCACCSIVPDGYNTVAC